MDTGQTLLGVIYLILGGVLYFAPFLVARSKNHPSKGGIGLVNLFFGWTIIGWVAAAAWAASTKDLSRHVSCHACRELIHSQATVCPHCQTPQPSTSAPSG